MAKILMVEDDLELAQTVQDYLSAQMHAIESVPEGKEALDRLRLYEYDLVILDLSLADMDGLTVLEQYRKSGGQKPVLILTGRTEIESRERGLDLGADDYLIKPFNSRELAARLRALLRRPTELKESKIVCGNLSLDKTLQQVSKDGRVLDLQPKEYALLDLFMRHPGEIFSPDAILNKLWRSDSDTAPDAVRVHLTRLRSKIDDPGKESIIQNIRGVGYKLEPPA